VTNGNRLETYAVEGERGSGVICVNGAAAHLIRPGDLVIIAAYCWLDEEEARAHKPKVVFVDEHNRIKEERSEIRARCGPSGDEGGPRARHHRQPAGLPRLLHRRAVRAGLVPDGQRGEVAPRPPRAPEGRLRPLLRRRAVPRRRAHQPVRAGEPVRPRSHPDAKLLLHRREIERLRGRSRSAG
jgi:tmRNA-binding protein